MASLYRPARYNRLIPTAFGLLVVLRKITRQAISI